MKKKAVKKTVKKAKKNPYHLLMYVSECESKIKKFTSLEDMSDFIDEFKKKHPDHMDLYSDYWIDYMVTDVSGDVSFFTDSMKVE